MKETKLVKEVSRKERHPMKAIASDSVPYGLKAQNLGEIIYGSVKKETK